jgi:predicted N-acyltransferase
MIEIALWVCLGLALWIAPAVYVSKNFRSSYRLDWKWANYSYNDDRKEYYGKKYISDEMAPWCWAPGVGLIMAGYLMFQLLYQDAEEAQLAKRLYTAKYTSDLDTARKQADAAIARRIASLEAEVDSLRAG